MPPAPASLPVETLVDSMKPEKPLVIESGTGGFGTGGAAINSGAASTGAGTAAARHRSSGRRDEASG